MKKWIKMLEKLQELKECCEEAWDDLQRAEARIEEYRQETKRHQVYEDRACEAKETAEAKLAALRAELAQAKAQLVKFRDAWNLLP